PLRLAHRLDARGRVARVVAADAGASGGPQQVAQRAVAEEVDGLVGELELRPARRLAAVALPWGLAVPRLGALGTDEALVGQALRQLLHGPAHLGVEPVLGLHGLPDHLLRDEVLLYERLGDGLVEV